MRPWELLDATYLEVRCVRQIEVQWIDDDPVGEGERLTGRLGHFHRIVLRH